MPRSWSGPWKDARRAEGSRLFTSSFYNRHLYGSNHCNFYHRDEITFRAKRQCRTRSGMLRAPYIPQLTSTALALEIITYGSGPFHALLNPWMRPYSFRMAMMRLKISANTQTQKKNVVSFVLCAKPRENRKLPTHLTNDAKEDPRRRCYT